MLDGIRTAAGGLRAQQVKSDAMANDIANLETPGYKTVRVQFRDLLQSRSGAGGAQAAVVGRTFGQAGFYDTGRPLDVAIEGSGFFQVRRPDGTIALTRDGSFQLNSNRELITSAGDHVLPGVTLPAGVDATDVTIAEDGSVSARGNRIGQIALMDVQNPDGLRPVGDNLFVATSASGPAQGATRAQAHQRQLEDSNASFTELVGGQKASQALLKLIQVEDELAGTINQLRR